MLVVAVVLSGCGGKTYPKRPTAQGPLVEGSDPAAGAWLFQPAGKPKHLVIFFHGQGGPDEATPVYHRPWIDHLVAKGNAVIYPRYEMSYATAVIGPAVAGVRTAEKRLGEPDLPVLAVGYSRGGGLAVEYAAVSAAEHVPVPKAVETVNTVAAGDQAQLVDLRPLRHDTTLSLILSDKDQLGAIGAQALLRRLRASGFPPERVHLRVVRSTSTFLADHAGPMSSTPEARKAYWAPTDALLKRLSS